jgi:hypothetical protein
MSKATRWRFSWLWALSYLDIVILSVLIVAGLVIGALDRLFGRANPRKKRLP